MCSTAVLRSQDCLRKPCRNTSKVSRSRRRNRSPPTGFDTNVPDPPRRVLGKNNNNSNSGHRKSSPPPATAAVVAARNNLVMGQVKILKRGEQLPDHNNTTISEQVASQTVTFNKLGFGGESRDVDEDDLVLCATGRLGPEPEMVQKQIRASDFYAGSSPIVASPPPSSLPFPAFFSKKEKKIDEATSDLLRLLRLDLQ